MMASTPDYILWDGINEHMGQIVWFNGSIGCMPKSESLSIITDVCRYLYITMI